MYSITGNWNFARKEEVIYETIAALITYNAGHLGWQHMRSLNVPNDFYSAKIPFPILVPRGRAPFGQHQESRPLARSNDIPVLNGFVNTIDWDQNQSDLSDLTQSMRRVTGSPWIADFRCWTRPEVAILGADQKARGLWGREWPFP